tara:strand:+ start:172 stop:384 length:213 start_codon:yes stop_codon:yes gene_type:complete
VSQFLGEKMSDNTPTTLNDMIDLLTEAQTDYDKFYGDGNKAAGTRVRKVMQQIKTAAHDVRVHVQSTKNG